MRLGIYGTRVISPIKHQLVLATVALSDFGPAEFALPRLAFPRPRNGAMLS
jgi:hypothetical protein